MVENKLNFSMIVLLTFFALVVGVTVEMILTLSANTWSSSLQFLIEMNKIPSGDANNNISYRKRLLASLLPVRIKLGESNFVDMSTPLVVLSTCFQQTVNLVCVSKT